MLSNINESELEFTYSTYLLHVQIVLGHTRVLPTNWKTIF